MPLVRFEVRNEYKLGAPELYKDAVDREDPKGILDGVAVAGLVGILRQLGDLAEFAGEVFHGLQEQVISTASRSHRLMTRVERVEAALPSLEKAMLSQTSHIHFAYTPGSEWHARIRDEHNHFIYTDLPRCIMNSYEECREPPRLQLLDRFDNGGPGSCLKKYSDPSFFRRASGSVASSEKSRKDRKARKMKRKRSWQRSSQFSHSSSIYNTNGRVQVSPPVGQRQPSSAQTGSTCDMTSKSDLRDRMDSFGSRDGAGFIECVFRPSTPMQADEAKPTESSSGLDEQMANILRLDNLDEQTKVLDGGSPRHSGVEKIAPCSSDVTWDEKTEVGEPVELNIGVVEAPDSCESMELTGVNSETIESPFRLNRNSDLREQLKSDNIKPTERLHNIFEGVDNLKPLFERNQLDEVDNLKPSTERDQLDEVDNVKPSTERDQEVDNLKPPVERNQLDEVDSETDNFVDALNTIESESETDFDCGTKRELALYTSSEAEFLGGEDRLLGAYDNSPPRLESPFESDSHQDTGAFHHLHDSTPGLSSQDMSLQHSHPSCNSPNGQLFPSSASLRPPFKEQHLMGDFDSLQDSKSLEVMLLDSKQHAELTCQCFDGQLSHDQDDSEPPLYLVREPSLQAKGYNLHGSTPSVLPSQEEYLQLATTSCAYPDELVSRSPDNSVLPESLGHERSLKSSQVSSVTFSSPATASSFKADTMDGLRSQLKTGGWYNLHSSTSSVLPSPEESLQLTITSCAYPDELVSHSPDNSVFPESVGHEQPLQSTQVSSGAFHSPVVASSVMSNNMNGLRTQSETGKWYNLHNSISSGDTSQEESLQLATTSYADPDELVSHHPSDNYLLPHTLALDHERSLEITQLSSVPLSPPAVASSSKVDTTNDLSTESEIVEFISAGAGMTSVMAPTAGKITGLSSEVEGVDVDSSGVLPVAMWTNGGLLGLAPSKPPDLSSSSNLNDGPVGISYKNRYQNPIYKVDEPGGKLDSSVKLVQCDDVNKSEVDRGHNGHLRSVVGLSSESSHFGVNTKLDESKDGHCKTSNCSEGHNLHGNCTMHSDTRLLVVADDAETAASECDHGSAVKSSLLSGLSRGLLMDGFRKFHSSHDEIEKPQTGSPHRTCKPENGQGGVNYHPLPETDLSQQLNSPELSPPPSPPLEHMNISVQPFHGYQSSKLKLAYPDGISHHEGALDSFPSFQLVPEPAILQHDVGSDSDDIFCRSHVCLSDDCLSHLSDSNSEFWESGDSSETQDHALYDGLCRASSESICSSPTDEGTTKLTSSPYCKSDDRQTEFGIIQSQSGTSLDLPVLDSSYKDTKTANHGLLGSLKTLELTPEPPPLPPWQWRESKPHLDAVQDEQNLVRGSLKQRVYSELLGTSLSLPAKPVIEKPINTNEQAISVAAGDKQHLAEPKPNGNKVIHQTGKGGKVDEKEDFLEQIRAKSFNLRRTDTPRPPCKPGIAANFKVTAILEKANAIRQAVASDGEETDTWSDT